MGTPPNPRWRAREAYYDPGVSPAPRGPMKRPKPSEEAKSAFARVVPDEPSVTLRPMFGQMSAFVNGNMFCGIYGEELVLRLPPAEIEAVKMEGGRDFEPVAGHKMGGYVVVPGNWRVKEIGRASCRGRGEVRVVAGGVKRREERAVCG